MDNHLYIEQRRMPHQIIETCHRSKMKDKLLARCRRINATHQCFERHPIVVKLRKVGIRLECHDAKQKHRYAASYFKSPKCIANRHWIIHLEIEGYLAEGK